MVMTGEEILVQALNWTLVYVREVALDTPLPLVLELLHEGVRPRVISPYVFWNPESHSHNAGSLHSAPANAAWRSEALRDPKRALNFSKSDKKTSTVKAAQLRAQLAKPAASSAVRDWKSSTD